MNNQELLEIAIRQSAIDCTCAPEDFFRAEPVVVVSQTEARARRYLELPHLCHLVYYGGSVVASVREELCEPVAAYLRAYPPEHCFETPNLHVLDELLERNGGKVCYMAEYFLPDLTVLRERPCALEVRVLQPRDFAGLYRPEWGNALCEKRRELDMLGVGAYDGGRLVGLAACSADCETMWQIGIDVLPEHRRQGVASALTSRLALEILARGKAPFYCAAWSNLKSVRNAIRAGFRPAWVEVSGKRAAFVAQMNRTT